MMNERFNRNEGFFGREGQERIAASRIAIIGVGGLGTHVVQQLALLGVGHLTLVDDEELDATNRNRYIGAKYDDPIPGTPKVNIGERIIHSIDPGIQVDKVFDSLVSEDAFAAVITADHVFGCLDNEGARLLLTELCAAYSRPYFDIASDIPPDDLLAYGGRICVAWDGNGCLVCLDVLDVAEAQADLLDPDARRNRDAIYGVNRELLGGSGPTVVSINGVVASLAVTEFMVAVTGIRSPQKVLNYYGHRAIVTVSKNDPAPDCYYCKGLRGMGDAADVQRYIRNGAGASLRRKPE
ncbi:MAG TPA: ThiF family adenylyltransferase [Nitrososphaera sp.]|nr:ThiF family adenylyltransferase [Nitrososphaera sp.]